ncbi:unnamed protein product [Ectocarpus sp. CCAP 1310/34]|nr:unnamed protein product [Ectocarpus sp. CCAP 1310/34]
MAGADEKEEGVNESEGCRPDCTHQERIEGFEDELSASGFSTRQRRLTSWSRYKRAKTTPADLFLELDRRRLDSECLVAHFCANRKDGRNAFARGSCGYLSMTSFLKVTVIHLVETRSFLLRRASNILYSSFSASGNYSRRRVHVAIRLLRTLSAACCTRESSSFRHLLILLAEIPDLCSK